MVVIINQMNDWEEVDTPVGERYGVRGGWLLKSDDAAGPRGDFLASPLSRSHLFFLIGHLALRDWGAPEPPPPRWMTGPAEERERTMRIAAAVKAFAEAHPDTRVILRTCPPMCTRPLSVPMTATPSIGLGRWSSHGKTGDSPTKS